MTWEYATVLAERDWSAQDWPVTYWFAGPDSRQYVKIPADAGGFIDILLHLGRDGWELVGPPVDTRAIATVQTRTTQGGVMPIDGSDWHRREFWLKRPGRRASERNQ